MSDLFKKFSFYIFNYLLEISRKRIYRIGQLYWEFDAVKINVWVGLSSRTPQTFLWQGEHLEKKVFSWLRYKFIQETGINHYPFFLVGMLKKFIELPVENMHYHVP